MSKVKNSLKPIDAPAYSYWAALYRSFYSRRLYVDVGKRWRGFGLTYLLLVLAILCVPLFFKICIVMNQSFQDKMIDPLLKMPIFIIQNGNVVFDKPMPYLVKNDKNQVVTIIDTTGAVTDFVPEYPDLSILVTKNQIAFKMPVPQLFGVNSQFGGKPTPPIVQPFGKGANVVFDSKKMPTESFSGYKLTTQAMIYPILVSLFFSPFLIFFLVLALLGQTFASIFFNYKINFKTSCRMLIVAGTPMLLLLLTLLTLDMVFAGSGVILFFLLIAYYSFALFSLRSESRRLARA